MQGDATTSSHNECKPRRTRRGSLLLLCVLMPTVAAAAEPPPPGYDPKEARARIAALEPRMSYLENDRIKVGVDLAIGGAITHLAKQGGPNLINSHDWGRQMQMSFYSGPNPYTPDGRQPHPHWARLGWNPIQSGDVGGHPSRVLEHRNDGKTLFVKCVPMQWPHSGIPAECTYEWTLTLHESAVDVRARIVNARRDPTQYPAKSQELPALYTNGPWYRLFTYTGDRPFTNAEPALIPKRTVARGEFPWNRFDATEHWAALVDENNEGVGLWAPGVVSFLGGFAGQEGSGGPKDGPTGYLAPVRHEVLDHDIVYDYGFTAIVGSLAEIRAWVYAHAPHRMPFTFDFNSNREHWYPQGGAKDAGWPITGALRLTHGASPRERLASPIGFWPTSELPTVWVRATQRTSATQGELQFELFGGETGMVRFPIRGDGQPHNYRIELAASPKYRGVVRQFFLTPAVGARAGDPAEIDYIGNAAP